MLLSELISQLQASQAEHGDGRVMVSEVSFMEGTSQLVTPRTTDTKPLRGLFHALPSAG